MRAHIDVCNVAHQGQEHPQWTIGPAQINPAHHAYQRMGGAQRVACQERAHPQLFSCAVNAPSSTERQVYCRVQYLSNTMAFMLRMTEEFQRIIHSRNTKEFTCRERAPPAERALWRSPATGHKQQPQAAAGGPPAPTHHHRLPSAGCRASAVHASCASAASATISFIQSHQEDTIIATVCKEHHLEIMKMMQERVEEDCQYHMLPMPNCTPSNL